MNSRSAGVLGVLVAAGLGLLGWQLGSSLLAARALERTVVVKGLAEREVPANIAIWPLAFQDAGNDLGQLYQSLQAKTAGIRAFLTAQGFSDEEISVSPPSITDLHAQAYGSERAQFRYTASGTVTVYSTQVEAVRRAMSASIELGRQGIAISGESYQSQSQFLFTGLNDIKPQMIEEATRNARESAQKFADDSGSRLGRIRTASQGQFSIENRDSTTPHIKRVRVVSTVEYYLVD